MIETDDVDVLSAEVDRYGATSEKRQTMHDYALLIGALRWWVRKLESDPDLPRTPGANESLNRMLEKLETGQHEAQDAERRTLH